MNRRYPDTKRSDALRKTDDGRVRRMEPEGAGGFVRFQYRYRSVSLKNGETHVKGRSARYEEGHMETEEFEGTLPGSDFMHAAADMQRRFFEGVTRLFNPFSAFLPDRSRNRNRD